MNASHSSPQISCKTLSTFNVLLKTNEVNKVFKILLKVRRMEDSDVKMSLRSSSEDHEYHYFVFVGNLRGGLSGSAGTKGG